MTISVIVPIYKGNEYLPKLIKMLEENQRNTKHDVELILSNDCPECPLVDVSSYMIAIKVLETKKNRGIHGARVRGLKAAKGEYVIFLDQDDVLVPDAINEFVRAIGKADICVANGYEHSRRDKRILFNKTEKIEWSGSLIHHFIEGNKIVSPGQVLIRKKSIPGVWRNLIMTSNCSDDWFLWILMMKLKRTFSYTSKVVFLHTFNGHNASDDRKKMYYSEMEMLGLLRRAGVIKGFEYYLWRTERKYHLAETMHSSMNPLLRLTGRINYMFYSVWRKVN